MRLEDVWPGGTLPPANVTPDNPQIGYLDVCMDWRFVVRDEERVSLLLDAAIGDNHSAKLFHDPTGIVAFAKVEKAAAGNFTNERDASISPADS